MNASNQHFVLHPRPRSEAASKRAPAREHPPRGGWDGPEPWGTTLSVHLRARSRLIPRKPSSALTLLSTQNGNDQNRPTCAMAQASTNMPPHAWLCSVKLRGALLVCNLLRLIVFACLSPPAPPSPSPTSSIGLIIRQARMVLSASQQRLEAVQRTQYQAESEQSVMTLPSNEGEPLPGGLAGPPPLWALHLCKTASSCRRPLEEDCGNT